MPRTSTILIALLCGIVAAVLIAPVDALASVIAGLSIVALVGVAFARR